MTLIVLNFKTYRESTGVEALQLAKICEDISDEYSVEMVVVPQVADIHASLWGGEDTCLCPTC